MCHTLDTADDLQGHPTPTSLVTRTSSSSSSTESSTVLRPATARASLEKTFSLALESPSSGQAPFFFLEKSPNSPKDGVSFLHRIRILVHAALIVLIRTHAASSISVTATQAMLREMPLNIVVFTVV